MLECRFRDGDIIAKIFQAPSGQSRNYVYLLTSNDKDFKKLKEK